MDDPEPVENQEEAQIEQSPTEQQVENNESQRKENSGQVDEKVAELERVLTPPSESKEAKNTSQNQEKSIPIGNTSQVQNNLNITQKTEQNSPETVYQISPETVEFSSALPVANYIIDKLFRRFEARHYIDTVILPKEGNYITQN
jgi:hypothetical protein